MPDYQWRQIEPLSDGDREIDLGGMTSLYEGWSSAKHKLQVASPEGFKVFMSRLVRRFSIETGILERIYDIDRGTTEALVTNGFVEELVTATSTDIDPSRLIDILRDHEGAIQLVMDCVAGNRELTKGLIHELHEILTKHQDVTTAIDQFGKHFEIPLKKGQYKDQPNNPKRPDGTTHEYCPPVHVDSEMDNLVQWCGSYGGEDPIIVASWFHHRFTQIHPYQDGNGRVARALATLIFVRSDLLPLVFDRDLHTEYIKALEEADFGDLTSLAQLFARLERSIILQALSIDADKEIVLERKLASAVIQSLTAKFSRRRETKDTKLRQVNLLAERLRQRTRKSIEEVLNQLEESVSQVARPVSHFTEGGPDRSNAHWYKFEVIQSAREAGKFVNFDEAHFFIKASIRVDRERLIFVTSFHHVGRELSGIMEATAFSQLESFEASEDRASVSQDFFLCSLEPFVFTEKTKEQEIGASFDRWLDAAIAVAIKEFGDRL